MLGLAAITSSGDIALAQSSIALFWTAPGDDDTRGIASRYDLRYSVEPVTSESSWWLKATPAAGLPKPSPAGATDSVTVSGLTENVRYYFVLRTADDVANLSPFSNVVEVTLGAAGGSSTRTDTRAALHARPNPSTGPVEFIIDVSSSVPQPVHIRLFDLSGRWVADLADGAFAPGQHTLSWTRLSRSGAPVAPGYYEALGTIGSIAVRERVVLLP